MHGHQQNYGSAINVEIKIGNEIVESVKTMKYLRVMIDHNLKLESHIDYICKKAAHFQSRELTQPNLKEKHK